MKQRRPSEVLFFGDATNGDSIAALERHVGAVTVQMMADDIEKQKMANPDSVTEPGALEPEVHVQETETLEDIATASTMMSASNARKAVSRVMELLPGRPVAREIDPVFPVLSQDSHVTQSDILLE